MVVGVHSRGADGRQSTVAGGIGITRRAPRWRTAVASLGSLRVRSTLVSVVVVSGALTAGGIGLVGLLRSSLREGVESTAQAQANDVTALLRLGRLPADLPAGRGDTYTQVVGPTGKVLAASTTLLAERRVSSVRPGEEGVVLRDLPTLTGSDRDDDGSEESEGPFLLLSKSVHLDRSGGAAGTYTVYVAGSLQAAGQATRDVGAALLVGLPVLVVLVGILVWSLGGRALRPVEAIRREVSDISGADLHRRVPEPRVDDEVGRLARTMNGMLDRLESSASTQRRFVADASHELRSPLAALQTTLEVALAHPDDAAWQVVATDALDEARRLHRLVEDLLELAQADETTLRVPRSQPVDLDEIVLREGHRPGPAVGPALDLHRVSAGRVLGDPGQLTRVVRNLIDNARRHAVAKVAVELSSTDDDVLLVVSDDGHGIAPSDRERVFDRFARTDEARSVDDGGTGLGLAIVREIVRAHGGTVRVAESRHGARLEVHLPADRT
jgi:signal transduction histidine kinase